MLTPKRACKLKQELFTCSFKKGLLVILETLDSRICNANTGKMGVAFSTCKSRGRNGRHKISFVIIFKKG